MLLILTINTIYYSTYIKGEELAFDNPYYLLDNLLDTYPDDFHDHMYEEMISSYYIGNVIGDKSEDLRAYIYKDEIQSIFNKYDIDTDNFLNSYTNYKKIFDDIMKVKATIETLHSIIVEYEYGAILEDFYSSEEYDDVTTLSELYETDIFNKYLEESGHTLEELEDFVYKDIWYYYELVAVESIIFVVEFMTIDSDTRDKYFNYLYNLYYENDYITAYDAFNNELFFNLLEENDTDIENFLKIFTFYYIPQSDFSFYYEIITFNYEIEDIYEEYDIEYDDDNDIDKEEYKEI